MTTYALAAVSAGHKATMAKAYFMDAVIDFSTTTNATNDVFQVFELPAYSMVLNAGIEVLTVDTAGNSGTVALGDGTIVYVAAAVPTSAAFMTSFDAVAEGFVDYKAADTLDVTVGTGAINAKIRVWAIVIDITNRGSSSQVLDFA